MAQKKSELKYPFLKGLALVAAVFGVVVCILVIANYFQINTTDPVNTKVINALVQRLNENPDDHELRAQIQELDLLARKAYFTNQWQVRTGGYLILLALAVFVISYQIMDANLKKQVQPNAGQPTDILGIQKNARIGIAILGGGLVVFALIITLLTQSNLGKKIALSNGFKNANDKGSNTFVNQEANTYNDDPAQPFGNDNRAVDATIETTPNASANTESLPINEPAKPNTEVKPKALANVSVDDLKRNFTSFRGYNGNGTVYQKNILTKWDGASGENILWKTEIPVQGYNSPIVWDNKVFLTGATEVVREVFCFDKLTGKLLWRTRVEGIQGSPAASPKTSKDTGLAAPTMATDGKRVYAIFGNGDIIALDMDGHKVWALNLGVPQNHYGHSSSLIMHNNKLIVQYDQKSNPKLMALSAETGETIWSTPRNVKISWASPIIANYKNNNQIILAADPIVASYNPENGTENWQLNCISGEVGPSVAYTNGIVFAINEYSKLVAISLDNPSEILWENDEILSDIPSPVAANGLLIVAASYGSVACYDAVSGQKYWDHELGNNIFASPMVVGENVYLMDTKGVMHIFKLSKTFAAVADLPLGENSVATPAFSDGHIFIRGDKNLFCIGK